MTLIGVQIRYIEKINAGIARWSFAGHFPKIRRGARHQAEKALRKMAFTEPQIAQIIRDALDMATLERDAE